MRIFDSRPALRWLAPMAFLLVVTGTGLVAATATADRRLPSRSAEQLLVDVQSAEIDGLSGTVVQTADLGIPEIPGASQNSSDLQSLISGTHTLRVWYSGPDKSRVALLGDLGESDVITNGNDVWLWSSEDNEATHTVLPQGQRADKPQRPADVPSTPEEAAKQLLAAVGPTTTVSTDSDVQVARRAAYELVLRPKDDRSLIREVRLALDGEELVPLRVQAFGAAADPVFEVSYTEVDFTRPDDAQFDFNPPPGAKVTEVNPAAGDRARAEEKVDRFEEEASGDQPTVVGEGWTTVVVSEGANSLNQGGELGAFLQQLPQVSGDWGSGRLLAGTAFSVVLTDDGRVAAGAVQPDLLYAALQR